MNDSEIVLGTVVSVNSDGVQIMVDTDAGAMTKRYKSMQTGVALAENDRILVLKKSGTYVVLGKFA